MARKSKRTAAPAPPTEAPRRGCLGGCLVQLTSLGCVGGLSVAAGILGLCGFALVGVLGAYQYYIVDNPGPNFDPKHVRGIIAQESPIYYRDGETRVGVFFEDEHRVYLDWDDLPTPYVAAIVAAEDEGFWTHHGISPNGLARAIFQNVTTGTVVSGGSTLTQQTAKNLFYRPDRSLKSKLSELGNALKLEAHFSKTDILTFYANQFHVSGNGRGLGIAARYFFDKDAKDLTTLECAFLAGLVKGPTNYDPFIQKTDDKRASAITRAHDRTKYVLRRIVDVPAETLAGPPPVPGDTASEKAFEDRLAKVQAAKADATKLLADDYTVPFKEGTFRYDSNAVLDEVARRLGERPFADVLKDAGIADPATAGLEVVTTLDEGLQRQSVYALWHHLTEAGALLEAPKTEGFALHDQKVAHDPDRPVIVHEFRTARVASIEGDAGAKFIKLDLGGRTCIADRDAVTRVALVAYRGEQKNKNAKVSNTFIDAFVGGFVPDEVTWVSIRDAADGRDPRCDLERRPELQGAIVVVQDGQVRAMVGGNDNRNYNRASAPRQMGSTWKPLLYHSAMQVGWLPSDTLYNRPNVFPFQGGFYYPTSDHTPSDAVSMAWGGVNSENIASVWLLFHLTDRLSDDQVKALAADLDVAKGDAESDEDWHKRLNKLGVTPSARRIDESSFLRARADVLPAMATSSHPEDELLVRALYYGWGFTTERARVIKAGGKDADWQEAALDHAWTHLGPEVDACQAQYRMLRDGIATRHIPVTINFPDLWVDVKPDRIDVACGDHLPDGDWQRPTEASLGHLLAAAALEEEPAPAVTPDRPPMRAPVEDHNAHGRKPNRRAPDPAPPPQPSRVPGATHTRPLPDGGWSTAVATYDAGPLADENDVLVDGRLHLSTLIALRDAFDTRKQAAPADPWADANLFWNQDFRTLLGVRYLAEMAHQYGVRTDLVEGLPLTLGASEITIEEAASIYDGIVHGQAWDFPGTAAGGAVVGEPAAPTLLITEIRDVDGNVLYKANPTPRPVTQDPRIGEMTFDILRNVVKFGTATRANNAVTASGGGVPYGGKTGTTNDYKNSAFLGYVPHADGGEYTIDGGYAVGVYVGYDDNRPMDVGNIKMAGANGALPAWIGVARGLQDLGLLGTPTGKPGARSWPVRVTGDLVRHTADSAVGLVAMGTASEDGAEVLTFDRAVEAPPADIPRVPKHVRVARLAIVDHRKGGKNQGIWGK